MILVFDLDDTLYDELTYVKSGFKAVSEDLSIRFGISPRATLAFMNDYLAQNGRKQVFDAVLTHFGIYSKKNVAQCVTAYRFHKPKISLNPEARRCLNRFKDLPKYIVTDGNKVVQANKVEALGLENTIRFSYITHRYGIKNAKPSLYCFQKICQREKVAPNQVVYVGDNPNKDFIQLKRAGFHTIRLLQGAYKDLKMGHQHEADQEIHSLDELTQDLLRRLF